jgi:hypothetical protein
MAEPDPIPEKPTLAEAIELLRLAIEAEYPGFAPVSIRVKSGDGYPSISLPVIARAAPPPPPTVPGRRLSPTEELVLNALADGAWKTGQVLATLTGQPRSGYFAAVLANLAEAGVVESSTRHGYRLVATRQG